MDYSSVAGGGPRLIQSAPSVIVITLSLDIFCKIPFAREYAKNTRRAYNPLSVGLAQTCAGT